MKAFPFPCIRPAQDRVLEALPAMGSILSGNDALRGALADGLMLKDPGAAGKSTATVKLNGSLPVYVPAARASSASSCDAPVRAAA